MHRYVKILRCEAMNRQAVRRPKNTDYSVRLNYRRALLTCMSGAAENTFFSWTSTSTLSQWKTAFGRKESPFETADHLRQVRDVRCRRAGRRYPTAEDWKADTAICVALCTPIPPFATGKIALFQASSDIETLRSDSSAARVTSSYSDNS